MLVYDQWSLFRWKLHLFICLTLNLFRSISSCLARLFEFLWFWNECEPIRSHLPEIKGLPHFIERSDGWSLHVIFSTCVGYNQYLWIDFPQFAFNPQSKSRKWMQFLWNIRNAKAEFPPKIENLVWLREQVFLGDLIVFVNLNKDVCYRLDGVNWLWQLMIGCGNMYYL